MVIGIFDLVSADPPTLQEEDKANDALRDHDQSPGGSIPNKSLHEIPYLPNNIHPFFEFVRN